MEKSDFLNFFYRHCMHVLTAPLYAITANDPMSDGLTGKGMLCLITIIVLQKDNNNRTINNISSISVDTGSIPGRLQSILAGLIFI